MPKRHIAPLSKGRVRLRMLEEADLQMTLAWRNQDHIRKWFLHSEIVPPEQHAEWFRAYRDRDDDFMFVIEETDALRCPVGQVSLYHVDEPAGRAEFGRLMIGEAAAAGRGLAREATAALVEEALGRWKLNEVYLEVKDTNAVAIAVYRGCGFESTGNRDGVELMRLVRSSAGE